jgi:hypothetical protein
LVIHTEINYSNTTSVISFLSIILNTLLSNGTGSP